MAIGDKALAKGMRLTPGTVLANTIDDEINRALDYVAEFTDDITPVDKGGTGATNPSGARANLAVVGNDGAAANDIGLKWEGGRIQMRVDASNVGGIANAGDIDALSTRIADTRSRADDARTRADNAQTRADEGNMNGIAARQGNLYVDSYGRALSGTRRALWIQDNGQIGYAASTQRYKKFIRPEDVTDEQLLQLTLVSYQWKAAVAADDRREMGLIAERLVEAGLGWACFYGEEGVEGINYEMIGVALLPAVQRLIARVARLEDNA